MHNLHVMRRSLAALAAAVAVVALPPASAAAAGQDPVIADCSAHNSLTGHYTIAQLRTALSTLPSDVKEYTACPDVINRQLLAQLGGGRGNGTGNGGGGSFLPTPVIVVLVVVLLGGATYAGLTLRRRQPPEGGS
jgi:hypothetical protein